MKTDEFKNYLKINIDSKNSQKNYFSRVHTFFTIYKEFNQENINQYIADKIDKNASKSWFNQTMTAFRHYEKCLGIYGTYTYPKYRKIHYKERSYLTKNEIEKELLPYFDRLFDRTSEFYKFIIRFLFYTGVRPDEFCKLQSRDIFYDKYYFIVRNPKDKDDKLVPFPKFLETDMKKYQQTENYAFKVSHGMFSYIFKKLNTELNYKKHLNTYMLRHSCAKYLLENGVSIEELQRLFGHSNIQTTMIYGRPSVERALSSYHDKIG